MPNPPTQGREEREWTIYEFKSDHGIVADGPRLAEDERVIVVPKLERAPSGDRPSLRGSGPAPVGDSGRRGASQQTEGDEREWVLKRIITTRDGDLTWADGEDLEPGTEIIVVPKSRLIAVEQRTRELEKALIAAVGDQEEKQRPELIAAEQRADEAEQSVTDQHERIMQAGERVEKAERERDQARIQLDYALRSSSEFDRLQRQCEGLATALREMMGSYTSLVQLTKHNPDRLVHEVFTGDPMMWDGPICARSALDALEKP